MFLYVGGNAKFQVLFGDVSKKNHLEAKYIETVNVSIYETVNKEWLNLPFGSAAIFLMSQIGHIIPAHAIWEQILERDITNDNV